MRGMYRLTMLLFLSALATACAPVIQETVYRNSSPVPVYREPQQPDYRYRPVYQSVPSVEVTLYADDPSFGYYVQPIRFVIADGQYVEIPVRSRKGRDTIIFAHYYQGSLHFDSNRKHRVIYGSSDFRYNIKWDMGHSYHRINAGKDFDLSGLRLRVQDTHRASRPERNNVPVRLINEKVVDRQPYNSHDRRHSSSPGRETYSRADKDRKPSGPVVDYTRERDIAKANNDQDRRDEMSRRNQAVPSKSKSNGRTETLNNTVLTGDEIGSDRAPKGKKSRKAQSDVLHIDKIMVSFSGGRIFIDGGKYNFKTTRTNLRDGESSIVTLVAKTGLEVKVPISYRNGILSVASGHSQHDDRQFDADLAWYKGKAYKINTKGSSRLKNVMLSVVAY